MTRTFTRWATPRTALVLCGIMVALAIAGVPLYLLTHILPASLAFLPSAAVGVVLARQRPRNPIGWVLILLAFSFLVTTDAAQYGVLAYRLGHPGLPLARLAVAIAQLGLVGLLVLPLPLLLFPDGQIETRFWRRTLWVYLALCTAVVGALVVGDVQSFTTRHIKLGADGYLVTSGRPPSGAVVAATTTIVILYIAIVLSWVVRQTLAFRRSDGDRRAQLKWPISGVAVSFVTLAITVAIGNSTSAIVRVVGGVVFLGVAAMPVTIAIGILKYRLYDIDRLISRTLSYAIVTGLLVGVYVGMIALTTRLIPLSSSVGVAASTLAAVGLFTPVRRRVQRRVDRRFNRSQYDAEAMVATFTTRLRDAVQLETVRTDLLNVVNSAVEPSQVSLWIRPMSRVS